MKNAVSSDESDVLKNLPSVDAVLQTPTAQTQIARCGAKNLTNFIRRAIADLRQDLRENASAGNSHTKEELLNRAENNLSKLIETEERTGVKRVINATGVVIHTNLGRAPLAESVKTAIFEEAARYCTLEYDIETGKRGKRGRRAENLLAELTGAEAALIVNNCAAACILVLTALAQGGEAILSRGEMVEIGGDFRIPDVMNQSGAILREVGATNKTRVSDYEKAFNEQTRLILKVHPSNYRIIGFAETPTIAELAGLSQKYAIPLYEDAGSGALIDLSEFGLKDEPLISASVRAGADVVTFSGDKLLGGVQSGLIVGKKEIIEKLRKHPFYRALRADKIVCAALEAALELYRREKFSEIPVLRMLAATPAEIEKRTQNFVEKLKGKSNLNAEIIRGNSVIGGGSAPSVQPETRLLALRHLKISAARFEEKLRFSKPPVITRIFEDKVLLDFRTIFEDEENELLKILIESD